MEQLREYVPWVYFVASVTFIFGLKGLSGPTTAQLGNRVAATGMLLAVIATFLETQVAEAWLLILPAMAIGTVIGVVGARQVPMTAMPQMVAIFNGAGGGAAALVSILEFEHATHAATGQGLGFAGVGEPIAILLGLMIGGVSFSGSIIAFGKLQGLIDARAFKYTGQQVVTFGIFAGMIAAALAILAAALTGTEIAPANVLLVLVAVLALAFGVALVMPIGGADMPVVISLLNAYTGLAVAMAGFSIGNQMLIVAGTLVGASGTILTRLMSKAMNRSLGNVLFGAFGAAGTATAGAKTDDGRTFREVSAEDAAILLGYAQSVIIVPGYGLAVAQAQHSVRELADLLEGKGIEVRYAIHPVAGRMPGHMNVLLAEANVPYEKLFDMEQINDDFARADVALVIGANDVTNPAARKDTASPIYGMPILNVDQAQNIIVIKRSMKPGFAGIDNELYLDPKTGMLFGDAKEAVGRVVAEVKKAG
ncbi:MAG TPA: NAD(P)(+) transhydrogenase (Re/Si-specific) subunit beta [Candidatus Limnocylindria bacterium]|nr:NAD(P)(+) transhydrogenase (Re/Si-specific) subunit beta [Candidatus Limnocylindria bacterium]